MILYKYKQLTPKKQNTPLQSQKDRDRIKEIITDNKIFYSNPRQLNDIFEFKPFFIVPKTYIKGC